MSRLSNLLRAKPDTTIPAEASHRALSTDRFRCGIQSVLSKFKWFGVPLTLSC
jgi:hypothetical protein